MTRLRQTRDAGITFRWLADRINRRAVENHAGVCRGDLLDIGCGEKPFEDILGPYVNSYIGLENPETLHDHAKVDVWGDVSELPFPEESFDTVVAFQVLEHIPSPEKALKEAFRVLRESGILILTTPFMWGIHEAPRDYYRYTSFGLMYLIELAGFEEITIEPVCGFWATWGLRFSSYLERFSRGPLTWLILPLQLVIQVVAIVLDRVDRVYSDAGGYISIAIKPRRN